MSLLECAWAAGLFEGEGCLYRQEKAGRVYWRLTLTMTDRDVVERFANFAGMHVLGPYQYPNSKKPVWSVHVARKALVAKLLKNFMPFLGARRREKALVALEELR